MPAIVAELPIAIMDCVDAMLANIVTFTGLASHLVYTVPDENAEPAVKKNVKLITMSLTSFLPDVGQQTGGAAYEQTFNQTWRTVFVVNSWTVYMVDQVGQNNQWLRDAQRGAIPQFMLIFKALEQFFPLDSSNNQMLEQPIRLSPGGFTFVPTAQTQLARIRSEWEASFIPKLP
jgi:arylamine N-acetyltransferase